MALLKLIPACKDYLWGGDLLKRAYHKKSDSPILAETWELSCHPDGPSVIANGESRGCTLREFIASHGSDVLGSHCQKFQEFPILIKFIDAKQKLSVQVHPSDEYALTHEGQYGKTEMWYVVEAGENAYLYYGFQHEISREEFAHRIQTNTLLETLHMVPVQRGDVFFIEPGTIHAIGENILIAEIQQNSNVTYRVYDYGRKGPDGKTRELHIDQALEVTQRKPALRKKRDGFHVASCPYFTVDQLYLDGKALRELRGSISKESFASLLFLDGEGTISSNGEQMEFEKGDSFFLTAGSGDYTISGRCETLITTC